MYSNRCTTSSSSSSSSAGKPGQASMHAIFFFLFTLNPNRAIRSSSSSGQQPSPGELSGRTASISVSTPDRQNIHLPSNMSELMLLPPTSPSKARRQFDDETASPAPTSRNPTDDVLRVGAYHWVDYDFDVAVVTDSLSSHFRNPTASLGNWSDCHSDLLTRYPRTLPGAWYRIIVCFVASQSQGKANRYLIARTQTCC